MHKLCSSAQSAPQVSIVRSGKEIAYGLRGLNTSQRALEAVAVDDSKVLVADLTDKQLAHLFNCSAASICAARELTPTERSAVRAGRSTLNNSARHLDRIVAQHGCETIWDAIVRAVG